MILGVFSTDAKLRDKIVSLVKPVSTKIFNMTDNSLIEPEQRQFSGGDRVVVFAQHPRVLSHELSVMVSVCIMATSEKRIIVSDGVQSFACSIDQLQTLDIWYGDFGAYEKKFDIRPDYLL